MPVIGKPERIPITEEHLVNPNSLYHITKYAAELFLKLPDFNNLNYAILRIPSPIGPKMPRDKILSFIINSCLLNEPIKLLGKGSRVQNYVDIRDIARAVLLAVEQIERGYFRNETFFIAGHSVSNVELAVLCKELIKSSSEIILNEKADEEEDFRWIIDGNKAKRLFSYEPEISLEESILNISSWLKAGMTGAYRYIF
jgi:UDP-glucose 4-epimerase